MALTTSTITGRVPLPTDENLQFAELTFALSGLDTEGASVLPGGVSTRIVLIDSDIPAGFELWQNTAGLHGTHYRVLARWTVKDRDGIRDQYADLGVIQVGSDPSYTLADLINNGVLPAIGTFWSAITQAQYDAVIQAAADAQASAADALASATAAAQSARDIMASRTSFAALKATTADQVVIGGFVEVPGVGVFKRLPDDASNADFAHTYGLPKWDVLPSPTGDYAIEAWGLDQYSTAAEVAAVIAKAIAKLQSGQKLYQKAWEYNCDAVAVTTNIRNVSITLRTKFVGTGNGEIAYLIGVKDSLIDWSIDANGADRNAIRLEDCGGSRVPQTAKFQNLIGNAQLVAAVFIRNSPNMEIAPTLTNCYSVGFKAVRGVMISDTSISENRSLVRPFIEEGGVTIYACAWNASGNTATRATYDAYPAGWQYWDSQALIGYKRVGSSGWATIPDYASGNTAGRAAYDAQAAGFNYWDSQALIGYRRTGGSGWTALVDDADGVYAENTVANHIGGLLVIGGDYNNCQKRFIKISSNNPIIMDNVGRNTLGAKMFSMISSYRPDAGVIYNNHMTTTSEVYAMLDLGASFAAEFNASGNTAGRAAYDAQAEGYVYYDTTTGTGYRRTGVSGWTAFGIGPWVTFDTNNNDLRAGVVNDDSRAVMANIKIRNGRVGDGDRFTGCRYMMRGYSIADTVAGTEKETLDLTFSLFDKLNGTSANAILLNGTFDRLNVRGPTFRGDTAGFYLVSAANIASGIIDISDVRHGYSEFCQNQRPRSAIDQRWGAANSWKFEDGRQIHLRDSDPTVAALVGDEVLRKTFSLGGWSRRVCSVAGTPGTFVTREDAVGIEDSAAIVKTADFTVTSTEKNLINNKGFSFCTVVLPSAALFKGRQILFTNRQAFALVSSLSNVVPMIGGAAGTAILGAVVGSSALLVSDGTNWQITEENPGKAPPLTKTADFTVADGEKNLINNKSGSTCTVTLPVAASYPGRELTFQNWQAQLVVSATSNVIPLAGGTAGAAILAASIGAGARLVSDGTNWQIVP